MQEELGPWDSFGGSVKEAEGRFFWVVVRISPLTHLAASALETQSGPSSTSHGRCLDQGRGPIWDRDEGPIWTRDKPKVDQGQIREEAQFWTKDVL